MSATVAHADVYNFVTKWGSEGSGNGQFGYPHGITVDSSGNVYVADQQNHRIQKFDSNGAFITKWGSFGSGNGQFCNPRGVAVDSYGNVYVADMGNNRIQKFDRSGTFLIKWGSKGSGNGQFNGTSGITVDSSGNIYVVEYSNNRIQKFDSNGAFITKWGSEGRGDGQFSCPESVAVDSSGNVYVADMGNFRIQKFDSNGAFITKWDSQGRGDGQFNLPAGVAVDSSDNVYAADYGNYRIQKFDSNGAFITKWGSEGSGNGQFNGPEGIAVDSSGNVYVADTQNNCIQKFAFGPLKITPIINWNSPADIMYGTALSSIQLSASASVPGTFVYTPISGTILDIGTQTLHVDFVPTDTAKYNTASADVQINVLPLPLKTPTITWRNPADIVIGTVLSSTQLNAVVTDPVSGASVAGTFTYNPAAGNVLSAGMGQTLHFDFTPTDAATYNTASKTATINVLIPPPNINSIAVPIDPVPVSTSITASANVTYLGSFNDLIAEWDWGDGSTSVPEVSSNFAASHVYNSADVYAVTFTLKDKKGEIYTQSSPNCVVVYDPNGGFVTGGGWINSPAGAYVADNTLAGKATFGFVSKYQKGSTVPTGKTEFQFNVADLSFYSDNYDWLIVAGSQAKYKGTGTINGEENYGFMLSAVDGAIKGDGIDRFRIKIWNKENEDIIYDNEIGVSEDSEPSNAISVGSVIIHKVK
ncbi:MAG: 6-bladed beta-propeller [Lachnospiraceae bacterium]|nr:6-bladed beta-propeller [Lachnospiraceae bacterium]